MIDTGYFAFTYVNAWPPLYVIVVCLWLFLLVTWWIRGAAWRLPKTRWLPLRWPICCVWRSRWVTVSVKNGSLVGRAFGLGPGDLGLIPSLCRSSIFLHWIRIAMLNEGGQQSTNSILFPLFNLTKLFFELIREAFQLPMSLTLWRCILIYFSLFAIWSIKKVLVTQSRYKNTCLRFKCKS